MRNALYCNLYSDLHSTCPQNENTPQHESHIGISILILHSSVQERNLTRERDNLYFKQISGCDGFNVSEREISPTMDSCRQSI
jgi:hypothetical protein